MTTSQMLRVIGCRNSKLVCQIAFICILPQRSVILLGLDWTGVYIKVSGIDAVAASMVHEYSRSYNLKRNELNVNPVETSRRYRWVLSALPGYKLSEVVNNPRRFVKCRHDKDRPDRKARSAKR